MDEIKIMQHNAQSWGTRTYTNIYKSINPDIIFINSYVVKHPKLMVIPLIVKTNSMNRMMVQQFR